MTAAATCGGQAPLVAPSPIGAGNDRFPSCRDAPRATSASRSAASSIICAAIGIPDV
jgi:hypothetical protein